MKKGWWLIGLILMALVCNAQDSRYSLLENTFYQTLEVLSHRFSVKRVQQYQQLNEREKQRIFLSQERNGVAILMAEFVFGKGPEWRYFHEGMVHTRRFMQSVGWREVCRMMSDELAKNPKEFPLRLHYQFSPNVVPFRPSTWYFAFHQNIVSLKKGDLEQFFLGSFGVHAWPEGEDCWRFEVYNGTSRRSLYAGLQTTVERPKRLGTIRQVFSFSMSRTEIEALAKTAYFQSK